MDEVMRFMFEVGTQFGSRYPAYDAIPVEERETQFRAARDALAGHPWTPDQWLDARIGVDHERDTRPHSRACGLDYHAHGIRCSRDCPTCFGGNPDRRF